MTACSASEGFVRGGESHGGSLLSGNNYRAVKMGAVGRSSGFSLFGFIPLWSPTFMEAKQDLLANVGSDLTGRSPLFENQMQDSTFRYFVLFALPRLTLTADVYEFVAPPPEQPATGDRK